MKEDLHEQKDDRVEGVLIQVVWGLGRASKLLVMLNSTCESRGDYATVHWIEARSKESIEIRRLLYGRLTASGHEMVKIHDAALVRSIQANVKITLYL